MKLLKKTVLKIISVILVILCVTGQSVFALGITKVYYAKNNSDFAIKTAEIIRKYDGECTGEKLRISGRTTSDSFSFYSLGAKECVAGKDGRFVLQFDGKEELDRCLEILLSSPETLYAEQDKTVFSEAEETDADGNLSWGVEALGADAYAAYLAENHSEEAVIVAIVDSGVEKIDYVSSKLVAGYDFIDVETGGATDTSVDSHGTFLASIVTDCTKNSNVKIMPVRVLQSKTGSLANAVNGIYYAVDNGAKVVNVSLGGELVNCKSLDDAVLYAEENGVSVVVCSGNTKKNIKNYCPAHNVSAITVSAVSEELEFAQGFSNFGDAVDMCAPGVSINGYNAAGEITTMSGTSMSAAYISACAAMFRLQHPECNSAQTQAAIKSVCTDLGSEGFDIYCGFGIPDCEKLITDKTVYVSGIGFAETEKTVFVGKSENLVARIAPENADNKAVEWSSSNPEIVSVDENGRVTAVAAGSAVITAKTADGGYTASITILAADPEITSVTVKKSPAKTKYTYKSDEALSLDGIELEVTYSDGTKIIVTDTSKMNASGFSADKEGTQTVTVEYSGFRTDFSVTVSYAWWQWIIRILLLGFLWY